MKKKLIYSLALLCGVGMACGCSDDEEDIKLGDDNLVIGSDIVYTGETLDLDFSGEDMYGKSVRMERTGDNTAVLTLYSKFDLSLIPGLGLTGETAGPGVLPGSPEVKLTVDLVKAVGGYSFAGTSDTEFCTYSYSGKMDSRELDLNISNVRLKNTRLGNTSWSVVPFEMDDFGDVLSNPLRMVWTSDAELELMEGYSLPMESLLGLVGNMPLIPVEGAEYDLSLGQALHAALRRLEFRDDSNIVAAYVEDLEDAVMDGGAKTEVSPLNMAHYVLTSDKRMQLFLNPQAIMKEEDVRSRADGQASGFTSLVNAVAARLIPMFASGMPLDYTLDGNNLAICVGSEVLLPIVKEILLPFVQNPELVQTVTDMIGQNPDMAAFAPMVESVLKSLPAVLAGTTDIQIGINLTRIG